MDFDMHKQIVETHVGDQVQKLFRFVREQRHHRGHDILPYPPRKRIQGVIEGHSVPAQAAAKLNAADLRPRNLQDKKRNQKMEEDDEKLEVYQYEFNKRKYKSDPFEGQTVSGPKGSWPALHEHPDGFSLEITESSITHPAAGDGLFVRGHCLPGSLVCFYPGTVYTRPQVIHHPNVIDGNEYMIGRYDSLIIDGREWAKRAWSLYHTWAAGMNIPQDEMKKFFNPFGTGSLLFRNLHFDRFL